ncbi:hypothetical protein, conserved [Babesia bigemina]|uniref:C2 NT-type domain-containing protein n=1 Tax=Babesia bigemina TaxID=5866 RepID=A0A061DCG8_BABBI|nr:hypothetical protein, conserved [Babesia bigemina]CDR95550.1 hypothetical protein, conserved [Babesia bigemina]|eukprot:XP_012767736.1 hypothetical protein, conserved [Babesia bigemina]
MSVSKFGDDFASGRFIFELTIHEIRLSCKHSIDVDLIWTAGKQRSQTGAVITLLPNVSTHNVDQKLLIHQTVSSNRPSLKSLIQVVVAHRYVKSEVLAECVIDLADLFHVKHKSAISVPLDTKLDAEASLTFSVMVTNFSFPGSFHTVASYCGLEDSAVESSTLSSVAESVLEYQGLNATGEGTGSRPNGLRRLESTDIYRTINKMATKLSRIESDIQRKTLKLHKINRKNLDGVNGIRSRLENQIALKDQQIRILTIQLDEMHTALALSHERELELGGFVIGRREFSGNDTLEFRETGLSKVGGFTDSSSLRYDFHRNGSAAGSSIRGSERHLTKYDGAGARFTNKDDQLSLLHNQRRTPSWHSCDNAEDLNRRMPHLGTQVSKSGYGDTVTSGVMPANARCEKQVVPLSWVKGTISSDLNASRGIGRSTSATNPVTTALPFVGQRASMDRKATPLLSALQRGSGREIQASKASIIRELRAPCTTALPLGKAPSLIKRNPGARLPQEAGAVMPELPRSTIRPSAHSAAGAAAVVASTPAQQPAAASAKAGAEKATAAEVADDRDTTIVRLERDLISTKVALADSETQRDIEIAKFLTATAHT